MAGKADVMNILAEANEPPREIAAALREFTKSAKVLSRNHPRLINEYPDKWVAVTRGAVRVHADSFEDLLVKVDAAGIPRSEVILRLIEREPRTFIL